MTAKINDKHHRNKKTLIPQVHYKPNQNVAFSIHYRMNDV